MKDKELNNSIKGVCALIIYYLGLKLKALPLIILKVDINNLSSTFESIYLIIYQLILVAILVYIYRNDLLSNLKDYIKNFNNYRQKYFKYWFAVFGGMIISNMAILILNPSSQGAGNEIAIRTMFKTMPIYTFASAVIIAPILEELVFRKSFRNIYKNNTVFIIVSGLVFGSVHVVNQLTTAFDLLYLIPYSIPGFIFAYTLVKSKNIFVPISLHFFHNFILMTLQAILLLV